jgi:hypothetical protein
MLKHNRAAANRVSFGISIIGATNEGSTNVVGTIPSTVATNGKAGGLDSNRLISVAISEGPNAVSVVASILNEATAVAGVVVNDGTSVAEDSSAATATNLPVALNTTSALNTSFPTSDPVEFLPQTNICSICNNSLPTPAFSLNVTSLPFATATSTQCPPATNFIPSCYAPPTITCTVTETWHSTHYESTATLYSFLNYYTVTETVR